MNTKFRLTKLEKHWVLYDIGNSAFVLLVATLLPIYFNSLAEAGGLSESLYLAYWGYAASIVTIIVAILGPICGTLADQGGIKKALYLGTMLLGAVGCAALGFAGSWLVFLVVFIVAKVGFSSSLVFYDSMLPEITNAQRMDNVSSMGYAFGYIGSVIPFILCLVLALGYEFIGISINTAMVIGFLLTAVWWIACSLPLAFSYRQTAIAPRTRGAVSATFRRLFNTVKEARKEKHIFLYLLAFFFFIDGVYTIIDMATAYGAALGLDSTGLLLALLVTQIVAFPFSIIFGRLSAKYDTAKLIKVCIVCYTAITVFAMFLQQQWQFWTLAIMVGMFQGGIQALSRSYLGKIIPAEQSGEYYGLMDIFGKGASFVGTTLVAAVSQATAGWDLRKYGIPIENEGLAVGTLVILFAIGFILFCRADKLNKARQSV